MDKPQSGNRRHLSAVLSLSLGLISISNAFVDDFSVTIDPSGTVRLGTDYLGGGTATIVPGVTVGPFGDFPYTAVEVNEVGWTVDNSGTLLADVFDTDALHFLTEGTLINRGLIDSALLHGVAAELSAASTAMTLSNEAAGTIQGDSFGVYFDLALQTSGISTIDNQGTITGGSSGVYVIDGATTLTNSGTIEGLAAEGVILGDPADFSSYELINSGTIIGNDPSDNHLTVSMGSGDDTVTLESGTRIVNGNIDAGLGSDTLNLHGSGTVTWINWNFEALSKDWSGLWELQTDLSLEEVSSTQILDGELRLDNISLTSFSVQILGPGTLSGAGTLDGSIVNSGTISLGDPGELLGTLLVSGTADFAADSKLVVDIGAQGKGDLLDVTGAVTTAETTDTIWVNEYTAIPQGDVVNVITAGSLTTYFGSLEYQQGPSLIVTFDQQVVDDNLGIVVTKRNPYSDYAVNDNQFQVAEALYDSVGLSTGDLGRVLAHLDFLYESDLQNAFEQLQPKPYITHLGVVRREADFIGSNLSDRMRERRSQLIDAASIEESNPDSGNMSVPGGGFISEPLDYKQDVPQPISLSAEASDWNSYIQTYTLWAEEEADTSIGDIDALTFGAFYGTDRPIGLHLVGGFCAGASVTHMETEVSEGNGAKLSAHLGSYFNYFRNGWIVESSATAGANWLSNWRPIDITGLSRKAKGSYDSYDMGVDLAALYELEFWGFTLTPQLRLKYDAIFLDDFTETGADSISLVVFDRWVHSLNHRMGCRLGHNINIENSSLRPEAWIDWVHNYLGGRQTVQAALSGAPQNDFTISFPGTPQETLYWGAGITLSVPAFTAYLHYQAEIYRDTWNHGIQGGVRF